MGDRWGEAQRGGGGGGGGNSGGGSRNHFEREGERYRDGRHGERRRRDKGRDRDRDRDRQKGDSGGLAENKYAVSGALLGGLAANVIEKRVVAWMKEREREKERDRRLDGKRGPWEGEP